MNALEAIKPATRVRVVRSVHQEHAPRAVVTLDPDNLSPAIDAIRDQILRTKRAGAGSYLFIDDTMQAYVLSELRSVLPTWLKEHFAWLVAFYAPRRRDGSKKNPDGSPYLTASTAGLTEDIGQHLADLRRVSA